MALKLGFCGTGGCGKTTTAKILSEKYGWFLPPSAARIVMERNNIKEADQINNTPQQNVQLQLQIWDERLNQENEYAERDVVWDRTLLDHFAYARLRCHSGMTMEQYREREKMVLNNAKSYDAIFYFPMPSWTAPPDGLRDPAPVTRYMIDLLVRDAIEWLKPYCPNIYLLDLRTVNESIGSEWGPAPTIEHRIRQIKPQFLD